MRFADPGDVQFSADFYNLATALRVVAFPLICDFVELHFAVATAFPGRVVVENVQGVFAGVETGVA